eukprot:CAMPEP_0178737686 /NCGR_PEP_ID=MMETSP0744-20121128/3109_1 /TAXON_ID=913974 /ORGANISM="Nitzschia punctata, Strain CCMP561" /LENGTH=111 /DNA_ID=CAMNT_0020390249 /DNA_START=296 /DNA_END=632 /DNA_ORIENTATION=+
MAFNPGLVDTSVFNKVLDYSSQAGKFWNWMVGLLLTTASTTPHNGALTGLYAVVAPADVVVETIFAEDEQLQDDLWKFPDELVKEYLAPIEIPTTTTSTTTNVGNGAEKEE